MLFQYTTWQVAKEHLSTFMSKRPVVSSLPNANFDDSLHLHHLLELREDSLFAQLGLAMKKAGKDDMFSTWMFDQSDLVQSAAMAFAERLASHRFMTAMEQVRQTSYMVMN